ncbi:hypothetical protein [Bacillus wiedmannii]|uniref:hypothetical protein n=1 Tax=Bacillus wiedmannii TaxID=1890302 RepID=UPI0015D4D98E|nr:hypothetical protein [Bacillus wiedmannii]
MVEAVSKVTSYLNKLSENKAFVIEKENVNSAIKSRDVFLCATGYNYSYSENIAD